MVNKKGDMLTPAQLVIIILAVIGLVMGLFILFSLNLKGEADDKACSLSVLSRAGTGSILPGSTQSFIPLKCTTKKICITTPGGKCSDFAGEQGVKTIEIPSNDAAKAAALIEKTNVESRYDCWNLMEQGKLDIFPGTDESLFNVLSGGQWSTKSPTCFICSRIALSDEFRKNTNYFNDVQKNVDFNRYMATNSPEGSQKTYLALFTDDVVKSYGSDYVKADTIIPSQTAYIFTQILTRGSPWSTFWGTTAGTGAFLVLGSKGKALGNPYAAGGTVIVSALSGGIASASLSASQDVSNAICGPLSSKNANLREGCSVVGRYDYNDISKINSQCFKIEGNP